MKPIAEYQAVRPDLFFWSAYEPSIKADLGCCAMVTDAGLVFVDPLPLAKDALADLTARFKPAGIIVTNANHERASAEFSERFEVDVYASEEASRQFDGIPRLRCASLGMTDLPGIEIIELRGFGVGEIALLAKDVLILGDALINLEPAGLAVLPDKYCIDPKLGRTSLRKLLRAEFGVMTFAHGPPLVHHARDRLHALLA